MALLGYKEWTGQVHILLRKQCQFDVLGEAKDQVGVQSRILLTLLRCSSVRAEAGQMAFSKAPKLYHGKSTLKARRSHATEMLCLFSEFCQAYFTNTSLLLE